MAVPPSSPSSRSALSAARTGDGQTIFSARRGDVRARPSRSCSPTTFFFRSCTAVCLFFAPPRPLDTPAKSGGLPESGNATVGRIGGADGGESEGCCPRWRFGGLAGGAETASGARLFCLLGEGGFAARKGRAVESKRVPVNVRG